MIRSSACQPWRADQPGHAGVRGDQRCQLHHFLRRDPISIRDQTPIDAKTRANVCSKVRPVGKGDFKASSVLGAAIRCTVSVRCSAWARVRQVDGVAPFHSSHSAGRSPDTVSPPSDFHLSSTLHMMSVAMVDRQAFSTDAVRLRGLHWLRESKRSVFMNI